MGFAAGGLVVLVAGVVQGCTGFGFALVATPFLMLLMAPKDVVPTLVLLSMASILMVAWEARRHIQARLVAPLAFGAVPGLSGGVFVLHHAETALLKLSVGLLVLLFACAMLAGWRKPLRNEKYALFPVGVLSGFLGGSTAMAGPPVVFFLANQGISKPVFRGSIACFFLITGVVAVGMFGASGMITGSAGLYVSCYMVPLVLGTFLGVRLARIVPEALFQKIVLVAVGCAGAALLVRNLAAL